MNPLSHWHGRSVKVRFHPISGHPGTEEVCGVVDCQTCQNMIRLGGEIIGVGNVVSVEECDPLDAVLDALRKPITASRRKPWNEYREEDK